jgi:hypothetical protein
MNLSAPMLCLAKDAIRRSPIPALRGISVEESESRIILRGSVPSYYLKQLAQETVMPVLSGRELSNRLTVERPSV